MNRLRASPAMFAALLGCAGLAAVEVWVWQSSHRRSTRLQIVLRQQEEELAWLARQSPAPTAETAAALAADLQAAERRLAELRADLRGRPADKTAVPAQSREALFAVTGMIAKLRSDAMRLGVRLGERESFGLASHEQTGPVPELIEPVHRQRRLIELLIRCLWEARPEEFAGLQRERPLPAGLPVEGRAGGAEGVAVSERDVPDDFFVPPAQLRVDAPGLVEGDLFRVEFTGKTPVLRDFLNALADHTHAFLVRSIEVEPIGGAPAADSVDAEPLVRRHSSRFTVVVAAIQPLPASASP